MKVLILVILSVFLLSACVTCGPCPKTDVMTWAQTPMGILPVLIPKDQFKPEGKGEWWEEYVPPESESEPEPEPKEEDSI